MGELKVQFMQIENKKSGQGMKYAKLSYFGKNIFLMEMKMNQLV